MFGGDIGGNFFEALGVQAAAGRLIGPEDVHTGDPASVAVVSWSFWKSRFDLDPGIIGKKIVVSDAPITIIGVAQRGFTGSAMKRSKTFGCLSRLALLPDGDSDC